MYNDDMTEKESEVCEESLIRLFNSWDSSEVTLKEAFEAGFLAYRNAVTDGELPGDGDGN